MGLAFVLPATALLAVAADYDPPIVIDEPIEEVPVEIGSGWYLRGDIGYNFKVDTDDTFDFRTFDPLTGTYGADSFDTVSLDEEITWGAGIDDNFTDMLRVGASGTQADDPGFQTHEVRAGVRYALR